MILGAHVSVAKGVFNAPKNGVDLGCDSIQIFCKNQRQWAAKPLSDADADAYRAAYKGSGLKGVMVHGSYLINCGGTDATIWTKSRDALLDEAQRCEQLGIDRLVMHPGAHLDSGAAAGCARIADALRHVLAKTSKVRLLLESMAGQGSTLGHRFEDLARIRELVGDKERVRVCLDTCHLYAAGFDISTPAGYAHTIGLVDEILGPKAVDGFHLNDSKFALGAHRDRHENIGNGKIGTKGFAPLLRDPRWAGLPGALETPMAEAGYKEDLRRLRSLRG